MSIMITRKCLFSMYLFHTIKSILLLYVHNCFKISLLNMASNNTPYHEMIVEDRNGGYHPEICGSEDRPEYIARLHIAAD